MRGLPQKRAYETVLRDSMAVDSCDPHGLYVGTRSGQLFGLRDEGKNWHKILEGLPSIVCLRTCVVDEGSIMPVRPMPKETRAAVPSSHSSSRQKSRSAKSTKRKTTRK